MKIAILGDIHANLEALESVLKEIDELKIDKIYSVGDLVGYNADPRACLDLIKARNIIAVQGNWDYAMANNEIIERYNPYARDSLFWTRGALNPDDFEYLNSLPLSIKVGHAEITHSFVNDCMRYLMNKDDALEAGKLTHSKIVFFGHTHVPITYIRNGEEIEVSNESSFNIKENQQTLVNVGSVGQPRDGDSRSIYCIYDLDTMEVNLYRCEYNKQLAHDKILKRGLREKLAERLLIGK